MPAALLSDYGGASQRRLALIEESLRHLAAGGFREAYRLADMSCQVKAPAAEDVLLRADIAGRLGFPVLEAADIEAAFALDPSSPGVQLRLLAVLRRKGRGLRFDRTARALLRLPLDPEVRMAALRGVRRATGAAGVAHVEAGPEGLKLAVFSSVPTDFSVVVVFEGSALRVRVETTRHHRLAPALGAAGYCVLDWPEDAHTARLGSEPALDWTGAPAFRPYYSGQPRPPSGPGRNARDAGTVTVIIPVYAGLARTRACIEAVLASQGTRPQRLVLIDDCCPDPALSELLAGYARRPGVDLIVNPINLAFIGSVNRALLAWPEGDVVLLNADTIVAPGWLDRLSRAAASRSDVGTVSPLSNNGELTSVPGPFAATSMPPPGAVAALDRVVAALDPGGTLELPHGAGFCLYITQACRMATGLLNDRDYSRGYLEEVDFCLRASERGLVHLCACDVFVGHAGGQSFGASKRGLVAHNLASLARAFPAAEALTERFRQADPLRRLRRDLQLRVLEAGAEAGGAVTLVIGRRAVPDPDCRDLPCVAALARESRLLRLSFPAMSAQDVPLLHCAGAMAPHRLKMAPGRDDPAGDLLRLLKGFGIRRIVYLDAHHPLWVRELPGRLGVGYEVRATDDSVLGERVADASLGGVAGLPGLLARAGRFTSASALLAREARERGLRVPEHEPPKLAAPKRGASRLPAGGDPGVAVFMEGGDGAAWCWLQALARAIMRRAEPLRLVLFGSGLDDDGLRRTGAVTVTAMPPVALAPAIFALHRCVATLLLLPEDLVEHPDLPVIAASPAATISRNRHVPDVIGRGGAGDGFMTLGSAPDTVLERLLALAGAHDG